MSMNSALSLSFQVSYIYIIIYLQYVQYVKQNFMEDQYPINLIFITNKGIKFYIIYFFREKSMPLGSPHLRLLLTGILQEVLL